ncbi:acyltransferase [Sphingomonas sp. CFBP9019]|uniref:acyltransferase family protein n=1 Tax=Sphingomonas sp. CFBP9019 TaxID=3096532 RepID=UPI002A699B70|nr:acyltransferase [Sphingomonas sp. CFBP9019]MDY1008207.1 acyltransferase [Sphingomonas sp. CFBP9019]
MTSSSGIGTEFRQDTARKPGQIDAIQALRAFAALAVVAHHAFRATTLHDAPPGAYAPQSWIIQAGAAGVDVFFVISGFLMAFISQKFFLGRNSPADFMIDRIVRVWPPYALVTLVACALIAARSGFGPELAMPRLLTIFFIPSFDISGNLQPIIGPGWTLCYEMMFYACFTLVIASGRKHAILKLSILIGALYLLGVFSTNKVMHVFLAEPIVFEFVVGALIGFRFRETNQTVRLPIVWIAAGLMGMLVGVYADIPLQYRVFTYGIPATLLFVGFLSLSDNIRWPSALLFIGNASYAIYLTHILVIYMFTRRMPIFVEHGLEPLAVYGASSIAILAAIVVGSLFYMAVEKPVLRLSQHLVAGPAMARTRPSRSAPATAVNGAE